MKEKTLNPDDFKRAIQAVDALGATPAVLLKVAELARDPNTDLATISAVLRHDGPLAADIIRISNSPYYAPATFHSNLTSAINFIGLREVVRVVNLSLSRQLFARDLSSYGISANDYWSASIAAALVMEALAKLSGLNPEDAYTIGILHALGRVLINRVIEEQGFTIYSDNHEPIADWERNAVGFDFAQAGAMLLEHWNFPTATCDVIRGQLGPAPAAVPLSLLGSLQFAQRLLALTGWDFAQANWPFPEADPFVEAAALTPELISECISVCRDEYQRIHQSVYL
jgi:HD-like signal output (HDOD) protein